MLVPPGLDLLLVFRVEGKPGSEAKATLDAPDQGLKGFPVDKLSLEGEDVTMGIQPVGLEFKGKRDKAGETIVGRAKLGPAFYPLTLKKVASATERRRPQMPKAPFPYKVEQVAYPSKAAGVRLAGTLTLPEGKGPFPAVVMITGSGPQDRDETLVGHKPFFVLADALTRGGSPSCDRMTGGTRARAGSSRRPPRPTSPTTPRGADLPERPARDRRQEARVPRAQ